MNVLASEVLSELSVAEVCEPEVGCQLDVKFQNLERIRNAKPGTIPKISWGFAPPKHICPCFATHLRRGVDKPGLGRGTMIAET